MTGVSARSSLAPLARGPTPSSCSVINSTTGLGLASISLAFGVGQLWWGLTQPLAGMIADRYGAAGAAGKARHRDRARPTRPEQGYSLAFVGYDSNPEQAEIELTYNHGVSSYELGTAYGHIALGMPDIVTACEKIRASGGTVTREPGPVKGGTTMIAFVADPDGYKIELIERDS